MEMIEFKYLKLLFVYSVITGVICAFLSSISVLAPFFSLFFVPFFGCVAPLVLLFVKDNFYSEDNKTYLILGAISGFFICSAYLFVFVPLVYIIHLFNTNYYAFAVQYLNLFLAVLFFVMIAVVYVTTNSVTGLFCGLIYKYIKGKNNA